jgi:PiT family inorganic phosphate transporter
VDAALLPAVLAVALAFAWTNGFHDAANAVATSLTTRALTPRVALGLAAVLNGVGALLGVGVARTIGGELVTVPVSRPGLGLVLAALVAAIGWNLLTWWFGVPSSSTHALVGGLAGAGMAAGAAVDWDVVTVKVLLPLLVSPVLGFGLAWAGTRAVQRAFRDAAYGAALPRFRLAQSVSAAAMALGHGLQDGQKTMGVMVLALVAAGEQGGVDVPWSVRLSAAGALALGTLAGGWRLIRTLGRRLVHVTPVTGCTAETVAAGLLYASAYVFSVPVSTTHTLTSAIAGAGASRGWRVLRWRVLRRIAVAWLVTIPVTALVAAVLYGVAARLV